MGRLDRVAATGRTGCAPWWLERQSMRVFRKGQGRIDGSEAMCDALPANRNDSNTLREKTAMSEKVEINDDGG